MRISKIRNIKIVPSSNDKIEESKEILNSLKGIEEVDFDQNNKILTISYNLELIRLEKIEKILSEKGIQLDNSFFDKLKRNWYHYTEQNELDNLHFEPTCCSNPKGIPTCR